MLTLAESLESAIIQTAADTQGEIYSEIKHGMKKPESLLTHTEEYATPTQSGFAYQHSNK